MMRMHLGLVIALTATVAFAVSCADSSTPEDEMMEEETTGNVCGDAMCAAAEVGYCMADCGAGGNNNPAQCGNGMCETSKGESASSCASDCSGGSGTGGGAGSGGSSATCPADPLECFICLLDPSFCTGGLDETICTACLGAGGGGGGGSASFCEGGAPDGTCNAAAFEDTSTCPDDCP